MKDIKIEQEVVDYISQRDTDFRLSTSCYGPVILPLDMKPPKETDIRFQINGHTLFVSRVQARYIDRITSNMIGDISYLRSCSVFRD
jgi:hypothetical protein